MWQIVGFLSLVLNHITHVHTQTLYQCNFDSASTTDNCFTTTINIVSSVGNPGTLAPNGALSDVTSSLTATGNGELCNIPYRIGTFNWDMYFCNRGYCPTESSSNSTCKPGKFGSVQLITNDKRSYQLKTGSSGINGIGQQCLIYYYYMGAASSKTITVRKMETSGSDQTIDSVTSTPFNGWIQRKITFNAEAHGYNLYFEAQKTSPSQAPYIGFDEISIRQGSCEDEPVTSGSMTTTSVPIQTTTTTTAAETTTTTPEPVPTTTTTPESILTTTTTPAQTTTTTPEPVLTTTTVPMQTTSTTQPTTTTIITTTTLPIAISTTQSSSSTTTTNIVTSSTTSSLLTTPVSTETTSTMTISSTIPIKTTPMITVTSKTTTTTSILKTSTMAIVENVIISSYSRILPREKSDIIVIAIIIPIVWIAFIIAVLWVNKSNGVINNIIHPFTNWSRNGEWPASYELTSVSDA
ncbi:unnamed protein product [Rotaria sordida]|uniref:MAM domain-containing protein n=1 Tax=Rotaria sordida TaxID=392033 RepID=A0A813QLC8_9BILA|nr:unnamed protein product [Rotaria sordida]CAF1296015.1 unnamed protein product [Rotaria sordida]